MMSSQCAALVKITMLVEPNFMLCPIVTGFIMLVDGKAPQCGLCCSLILDRNASQLKIKSKHLRNKGHHAKHICTVLTSGTMLKM